MNQKCPETWKVESEIKNAAGTICTTPRTNKYRAVTYWRRWGHQRRWGTTEKSFRKMELLEFEEQGENNARFHIDDDDDNYDKTDLFREEDDEDYDSRSDFFQILIQ